MRELSWIHPQERPYRHKRGTRQEMTSAALPKASGPRHLLPEEIFYLAFEGGGGKGLAFLGELQVLEGRAVLNQVRALSGSSAEAITALMSPLVLQPRR